MPSLNPTPKVGEHQVPPLPALSSISWKRGSEGSNALPLHPNPNPGIEIEIKTFTR
jgi:hypothetical protein